MSKSSSALRITSKRSKTTAALAPKLTAKQAEDPMQTSGTAWGEKAVAAINRMKIDPVFAAKIAKKIF